MKSPLYIAEFFALLVFPVGLFFAFTGLPERADSRPIAGLDLGAPSDNPPLNIYGSDITLRDIFAAASIARFGDTYTPFSQDMAASCYQNADKLLQARKESLNVHNSQ